jgi:outer membrane protein OmpA-like peptidoglycan-associated protein
VVLSEDEGGFKFGQAKMPDEMQAKIDEIVSQLKANPNGGYIEIEGHTDNVGPKDVNYKLGLERAEAVKRYLYENQQVPLHKMNVISYGEEKPVSPNKTRAGRAQNRRVVIKVLA